MTDPRVDKMIEMLCQFVEDCYVRNTHDGTRYVPLVEHFLCRMLEAMDEKAFDVAYNKAKARMNERMNEVNHD